jgi:riboflavin kinase/FMN adenylyltransferase
MKIIYGLNRIRRFKKPVVAMGVFDGVHRGHKEILCSAVNKAHAINGISIALTFCPHPQKKDSLYSLQHRLRLILELGVDVCIVIDFKKSFARMKAEDFTKKVLVNKINAKYIYVGSNFRFGRNASGDLSLLYDLGKSYGFQAKGFKILKSGGRAISSTLIRNLIRNGRINDAAKLLGRHVSILGTVIKGTAIGRILGFPTANIDPHHEVIPALGIYAVNVILRGKRLKGVCYVGKRPTLGLKNKKISVEVYILNFCKNIYGEYIEIQFIKRIREDKKFPSLSLLVNQIQKDIFSAEKILS